MAAGDAVVAGHLEPAQSHTDCVQQNVSCCEHANSSHTFLIQYPDTGSELVCAEAGNADDMLISLF